MVATFALAVAVGGYRVAASRVLVRRDLRRVVVRQLELVELAGVE